MKITTNEVTTNRKMLRKPLITYKSRIVAIEYLSLCFPLKNLVMAGFVLVLTNTFFTLLTIDKKNNLENSTLTTPLDFRLSAKTNKKHPKIKEAIFANQGPKYDGI